MKGLLDEWLPLAEPENQEGVSSERNVETSNDLEYERELRRFAQLFVTEWRSYEGPAKHSTPLEEGW